MQQLNRPKHPTLKAVNNTAPPAPKFQFFQHVAIKDSDRHGYIVGMEYVAPIVALVEGKGTYGWRYTLRAHSGIAMRPEEAISEDFEAWSAYEFQLEG